MISPLPEHQAPAEVLPEAETPQTIPISIAEREEFFTAGDQVWPVGGVVPADAGTPLVGEQVHCCAGVDMPGVGHVRTATIPGADPVEGEFPATLRNFVDGVMCREEKQAVLLIKLMYAARQLADYNLLGGHWPKVSGSPAVPRWCRECQINEIDGRIEHAAACRTGHVATILGELQALGGEISHLDVLNPTKKEAAADGERGCAGHGIGPRGVRLAEAALELRDAALNEIAQISDYTFQCNACGSSWTGLDHNVDHVVHGAGCWVRNALIVLSSDDIDSEAPVQQQVPEASKPLIVANLTAEEFKRFMDAKIPDTASSKDCGEDGPYIATYVKDLHAVLCALSWEHAAVSLQGGAVVLKRQHAAAAVDVAAGAMADELRAKGGAR